MRRCITIDPEHLLTSSGERAQAGASDRTQTNDDDVVAHGHHLGMGLFLLESIIRRESPADSAYDWWRTQRGRSVAEEGACSGGYGQTVTKKGRRRRVTG